MALKATIYKATVNVADLDRNQFLDASLTLAQHPSETQERMMLRLLAWIKYADERLQLPAVYLPTMKRNSGCLTIIWAWICGLNWGYRTSGELKKPARGPSRWRCSPIIVGRQKSGGSKTRTKWLSFRSCRCGIWMILSRRSSALLPIGPCRCRRPSRTALSGYLTLRIIWKFI